jgi:hypothetical protein
LSDFIQIRGKIVMHFLNKGGGGGGCLGGDLHREERGGSGQRMGSLAPVIFWREEMSRRERRRE